MAKRKSSAKAAGSSSKKHKTANRRKETSKKEVELVEEEVFLDVEDEAGDKVDEMGATMDTAVPSDSDSAVKSIPEKRKRSINLTKVKDDDGPDAKFIGDPIPVDEAKKQWPHRYNTKGKEPVEVEGKGNKAPELVIPARRHYSKALVDGKNIFDLYDDAYVQSGDGEPEYICQIVEMFEATDGNAYFTARWFYRSVDTDIKLAYLLDEKRVFLSEILDDNPLDCLVKKLSVLRLPLEEDGNAKMGELPTCDYYCDMQYLIPYSTFIPLPSDLVGQASDSISTVSTEVDAAVKSDCDEDSHTSGNQKTEATLLDLYSGCGAMSTGLCLGANLSGLNLVTKWAVDFNKFACESLKLNHPETEVRNATVEDFLALLKEWEKLCIRFSLIGCDDPQKKQAYPFDLEDEDEEEHDDIVDDSEVFEVEEILEICYGDVVGDEKRERGLYFKVSWKNYDSSYDTWEPLENLGNCHEAIKDFVSQGYKSKILPLPGHVDVICGGPPCQGISGFNRFRNRNNPLADEKNKQLIVFMDVVKHLKPKFVLMENVVDLLKFAGGALGRYGLGRLIEMNYQARIGMMAAGAYGLPQYRMRVFLWGACASEQLPQYPYPTHNVNVRGVVPLEFERNVVAYSDGCAVALEDKLFLEDAISDLPKVDNFESRDEMPYGVSSKNEFQRFIRSRKNGSMVLYDHRPYKLNTDDYQRVCHIPKRKGANFRDLPGVILIDNKSALDPNIDRVYLPSNKPLVPDYAITFVKGTSSKPFARLWWDETVPTVVTRAEPHNQAITHPTQDRVLTIRENARLQGFPDYYKLLGPVKERYIQVGNAVAVPVARALGYALGMAFKKNVGDGYLFTLPAKFPNIEKDPSPASSHEDAA